MTYKQKIGKKLFKNLPVSRHVFDHVRAELNAIYVRTLHRISPFYKLQIKKLGEKKDILLNLGCGPYGHDEGWINLDLFPIKNVYLRTDCRKSIPLADSSCKGIHVEMFVEHLDPIDELPFFLLECKRILQQDGILRIIVPDASLFLKAYFSNDINPFSKISYGLVDWTKLYECKMDAINQVFLQGYEHFGGWDRERMTLVLQKAGFENIKYVAFGEGDFPGGSIDREYHRQNGLYVEVSKKIN